MTWESSGGHRKHMIYGFRNYYEMITWHNSFHILWYQFNLNLLASAEHVIVCQKNFMSHIQRILNIFDKPQPEFFHILRRFWWYPWNIRMISWSYIVFSYHTHNNIEWHGCHDCTTVSVVYNFEIHQGFRTLVKVLTTVPVVRTRATNILHEGRAKERSSAQTRCRMWKSRLWQDPFPLPHWEDARSMSCRSAALTQLWQCQCRNSTWECRCYLKGQVSGQHLLVKPNEIWAEKPT